MGMNEYQKFLEKKSQLPSCDGFEPVWMPDFLYPFQVHLVDWSLRKGRSAIFADCGLGKTPMQLVWAENVRKKTNKNVLILTPLAVSVQTKREAEKFGIGAEVVKRGKTVTGINITNYEMLHCYQPDDFAGVVCDESSILKNYDGKMRKAITDFANRIPHRLLCTATPAPNDYMELGTSSEALGYMQYSRMLGMYFTNDGDQVQKWRLKSHARRPFWKWVASWARAIRKPSDMGYEDKGFLLPPMEMHQHTVASTPTEGLLVMPAETLEDQRKERRITKEARCEKTASIANETDSSFISWCHLNAESSELAKRIKGGEEIVGSDKTEEKESKIMAFVRGDIRVLITKPSIAGFGMNFQHCHQMSFFPSHSHEQFYQASRRCWRFGQKEIVHCHIVTSEAESAVMSNMKRKERQATDMFDGIIKEMGKEQNKKPKQEKQTESVQLPNWI